MLGAFFFGWLTDRLGRKKLFTDYARRLSSGDGSDRPVMERLSFSLFRFLTGAGIGGEYTAINSTIQELIPARFRGWTDLLINGSFWVGAALGAGGSLVLLDPAVHRSGTRLAACFPDRGDNRTCDPADATLDFGKPALADHSRLPARAADTVVRGIEAQFDGSQAPAGDKTACACASHTPLSEVAHTLFVTYRRRTLVGLSLMSAQAFFYNAIFFTYALILTDFYDTPAKQSAGTYCRSRPAMCSARSARPPVRHDRPQDHDRVDLCAVGRPARRDR